MIKELLSNYLSFINNTKKESFIAILAGILGAITETIAIYFLSEIIRDLEYLKINESINNGDINFAKE